MKITKEHRRLATVCVSGFVLIGSLFYGAVWWLSVVATSERGEQTTKDVVAAIQRDIAEGNGFSVGATLARLKSAGQIVAGELIDIDSQGKRQSIFKTSGDPVNLLGTLDLSHFGCDADKTASVIQKSFIEVATIIRTSKESSGCRILYIAAPLSQELAALLKDLVAIFVLLLIPIIGGLVSVTWWWQKALSRTELKLKDAELKAMNAERAKEAAVANMAQNVAHDIKNPLAIFEFARLAKSWAEFTALRESMTQSLDSIYIILADLGRKDSSLVLRRSKTILNFPSIVTDLTRILSTVTSAKLTANGPDSVTVILDWVKIERVLSNLIRNAAEAGAKNIHMGWECHDSDLLISVSDDGPGIPPEVLGRLFQRGNTKGKEDGTGIGLYNVKAITEAHRGKVEHSRENGRTIFKVLLPGVIWNDEMAHEAEEQEIASPPEDLGPLIRPYALVMLSNRERQNAIIRAVNALGIEALHEEDPEAWPMIFYTDDFRLIGRFPGSQVTSTNDIGDKPIEQAAKTIVQVVRFRMRDASAVKENDPS